MAQAFLTSAQYKKKYGANWKTQLAADKAALKAASQAASVGYKKQLKSYSSSGYVPESVGFIPPKQGQAIAKAQAALPHKPKSTLTKLGGKLISGAATALVGGGLLSAASSALASSGIPALSGGSSGVSDLVQSATSQGGFGLSNLTSILPGGDSMSGFGDILDTIGGYASEAEDAIGQVSGLFGKSKHTGSKAVSGGSNYADSSSPQGPSQSGGSGGMSTSTLVMIGGAALLLVLLLKR